MEREIDPQFAGIFVAVAVLQISLVGYARGLPYVEPESIEDVDPGYTRVIMPDRLPEPPKHEEPIADVKQPAASKPSAAKPGPKSIQKREVRNKGLIGAIGRAGATGAVVDVFDEGRTSRALEQAFDGIDGVELGGADAIEPRRGGGEGGVDIPIESLEPGVISLGDKRERLAPQGEAEPEGPEVDGSLSETEVRSAMKRYVGALKACYEGALKVNRKLGGKLVLKFEVSSEGRTQHLEFDAAGLKSSDVEECIARRARHWRFPRSEGTAFVEYPILFTPGS